MLKITVCSITTSPQPLKICSIAHYWCFANGSKYEIFSGFDFGHISCHDAHLHPDLFWNLVLKSMLSITIPPDPSATFSMAHYWHSVNVRWSECDYGPIPCLGAYLHPDFWNLLLKFTTFWSITMVAHDGMSDATTPQDNSKTCSMAHNDRWCEVFFWVCLCSYPMSWSISSLPKFLVIVGVENHISFITTHSQTLKDMFNGLLLMFCGWQRIWDFLWVWLWSHPMSWSIFAPRFVELMLVCVENHIFVYNHTSRPLKELFNGSLLMFCLTQVLWELPLGVILVISHVTNHTICTQISVTWCWKSHFCP